MSALSPWWRGLAARERLVLMLGGGVLFAVLYGVLLLEPLQQRVESLDKSRRAEAATLAWLEAQRGLVASYAQAPAPVNDGRSVLAVMNEAASAAGIAGQLKRITPLDESQIIAGFEDVPYGGFMRWLQTLTLERGARVLRLRMERRPVAGLVSVELTLGFP